jgi:hypothetical protein
MVYVTQNFWVSGHCLLYGFLNIKEHDVSETGSVLVVRSGEEHQRVNLNQWNLFPKLFSWFP